MEANKRHIHKPLLIAIILLGMAVLIGLNAKSLSLFSSKKNTDTSQLTTKAEPEAKEIIYDSPEAKAKAEGE